MGTNQGQTFPDLDCPSTMNQLYRQFPAGGFSWDQTVLFLFGICLFVFTDFAEYISYFLLCLCCHHISYPLVLGWRGPPCWLLFQLVSLPAWLSPCHQRELQKQPIWCVTPCCLPGGGDSAPLAKPLRFPPHYRSQVFREQKWRAVSLGRGTPS